MTARVLIATSRYYEKIALELESGAIEVLTKEKSSYDTIIVPGAFEIPGVIAMAADSGKFDGAVALGCVIRGETSHYDHICTESARGLMELIVHRRQAIGLGILTCENHEQAWVRADRKQKNKGADAANACLKMIALRKKFVR